MTLAKERVDWILENHRPDMLDKGVSERLETIVKESRKR